MRTINLDAGATTVRLTVDENDHIGRIITTYRDFYERPLLDDAAARLATAPPGCVLDVGAHIGNHALYLAAATGRRVIALEPNTATRQRLTRNVQQNDLPVTVLPYAAGASTTPGSLLPPRAGNSGTAAVKPGAGDIEIVRLDGLALGQVAMVKIDTEDSNGGVAVTEVLAGAAALIEGQRPLLYVEGDRDEIAAAVPTEYVCFGTFGRTPTHGFQRRRPV